MSEERNFEEEARQDGWVPVEDWKGEAEKHVDAKTFVERGEKISGILKSKIGRLEDRIDNLTNANAEFKQYTDKQLKSERDAHAKDITRLEDLKAAAISEGDGPAAVKAEREIADLRAEQPKEDLDRTAYNQMAQKWASENSWYATNKKLGAFANGVADEIVAQGYTGQAYFDELTRQVKDVFPEEFENTNRNRTPSVESGGQKEAH